MPAKEAEDPAVFRMNLRPRGARSLFLRFLPGFLAPWLFVGGLLVFCGLPNSAEEIVVITVAMVVFVVACVIFAAALADDQREAFVRCDGNQVEFHEDGASICFTIDQVQSVALSEKDECIVVRDGDDVANLLKGRRIAELRQVIQRLSAAHQWARGKTPLHRATEGLRLVRVYENNFNLYQLAGTFTLGALMVALAIGPWVVGDFRSIPGRLLFGFLFFVLGWLSVRSGIQGWKDRAIPTTVTITAIELRIEETRRTDVFDVGEIVDVLIDRRDDRDELLVRTTNDECAILRTRTLQEQQDAVDWIRAGLLKARGLADD